MRILPMFLLVTLLGACGSTPSIIPETLPCKVAFKDYVSQLDLFLINEAHTSKSEYYSQVRNNADTKVIPDLHMGALMLQLEDFGFFELAVTGFRRTPGARSTLMVERGGLKYSLSQLLDRDPDEIRQIENCNRAFRAMFDSHTSMQVIQNNQGKELFESQQRNLGNQGQRKFR
jgi:hypothetical protein